MSRSPSPLYRALRRSPRGGGIFNILGLILTAVLTGGIGVGILAVIDASSCTVNVFWGCGSDSGGIYDQQAGGTLCASAPNSCGDRNVGTLTTNYSCPDGYLLDGIVVNGGDVGTLTCYSCPNDYDYDQDGYCYPEGYGDAVPAQTVTATKTQTCSAPTPPDSTCNQNCTGSECRQSCNSPANACGMTASGYMVNGSCNAQTPSNTQCACTSPKNACGQTNNGFLNAAGVCTATAPSNASCPPPSIPDTGFHPNPPTLPYTGDPLNPGNDGTTLYWDVSNITSCTIVGDNGLNYSTTQAAGSLKTDPLTQSTVFTLTCEDGTGGPTASKSVRVVVDPHYKEI